MEQQQSIANSTTSQQNMSSSSSRKPKIPLKLDVTFAPVGDFANKFSTRAGELIRIHVPVNFTEWRNVPVNFKDDVWTALMDEFELPFDPKQCRPVIETGFPPLYRGFKSDLRDLVRGKRKRSKKKPALSEDGSVVTEVPQRLQLTPELWEAARDKVPAGMYKNIWQDFVDYEKQPEVIEKNTVNARSRARSIIRHTLGRCSYNNKKYKLDESGILQVPEATTDKWLFGHQCKDGTVHPTAEEAYKKVTEAKEKYKEAGPSGVNGGLISEPLEDVFGANRKDCIRGHSSRTSKKQAQMAAVAHSALQKRDSENEKKINKIETEVSMLGGQVGSLNNKVDALIHFLKANNVSAPANSSNPPRRFTPSPEKGSTSHPIGGNHRVLDNEEIASAEQVELLNNNGEAVALGKIHPGNVLHCKNLKPNEKKVYVELVYDQEAALWDPPQGDNYFFLRQLILPTWVKWSEDRIQPANSETF